ncbi:MAG: hypothetical protein P4M04_03185 [Acidobacteriota bacterium]|nr:hypothetical protein [Acidobacteriota bacterium]
MSRLFLCFSLVEILLFASPLAEQAEAAASSYDDPEAYKVYAVILPSEAIWKSAKTLMIRVGTESFANCVTPDEKMQPIADPAIDDYVHKSERKWLRRNFEIDKPYELIYSDQIKTLFASGGDGWQAFYERYPDSGGYVELSPVRGNDDRTVAVVYMGHHCHWLCGGGHQYVLQKKKASGSA